MALPPLQLLPRGPQAPLEPHLLQPFLLPETFYPQGSANLCQLPGQEQPLPATWAPLAEGAPQAPQAPPAGLQRAPCGCYFDPRIFYIQWTNTSLPQPATSTLSHSTTSLPGADLWDPWGSGTPQAWAVPGTPQDQLQHQAPYKNQSVVAPAPPVLSTSLPGYQHEGQSAENIIPGTATPMGASPGSNILPGNDVSSSLSAAPHDQGVEDPATNLAVSEDVPLEEILRFFDCSVDAVEVIQDGPDSSPMPGNPDGTGTAIPPCDFDLLSLPEELLTPNYNVPDATDITLSLEEFNIIGMEPQEMQQSSSPCLAAPWAVARSGKGEKNKKKKKKKNH
ncbi:unnamed protein product, partial [Bubo scandiacus]